jgi:hypothetical protein
MIKSRFMVLQGEEMIVGGGGIRESCRLLFARFVLSID